MSVNERSPNPVESTIAQRADIIIIGAGAAGLMAAIQAGRAVERAEKRIRIIALDSAKSLGAKILVAGGGRCNVTHFEVNEQAFAGSSRNAIRKVLLRFDVPETVELFREIGVELKREETGKLFPTTDKARTVLDALVREAKRVGVEFRHPARVTKIVRENGVFQVATAYGDQFKADCVIIATGGKSLPKSGSDGFGYELVKRLGHSITKRVFPSLVPLLLPDEHFLCELTGVSLNATLEVRSGTGKKIVAFTNSTLLTHFGLSGPGPLDISRYWIDAKADDSAAQFIVNWLPNETFESVDARLAERDKTGIARRLAQIMPERLARALCEHAAIDPARPSYELLRDDRKRLAHILVELPLPITGDRGFTYAEVTAGGVPLNEIELKSMQSRACPGLFLCGEICDVDGRIGGFNFQWAWASGFVAGTSAADSAMKVSAQNRVDFGEQ